jgi:hypothetical protein
MKWGQTPFPRGWNTMTVPPVEAPAFGAIVWYPIAVRYPEGIKDRSYRLLHLIWKYRMFEC